LGRDYKNADEGEDGLRAKYEKAKEITRVKLKGES